MIYIFTRRLFSSARVNDKKRSKTGLNPMKCWADRIEILPLHVTIEKFNPKENHDIENLKSAVKIYTQLDHIVSGLGGDRPWALQQSTLIIQIYPFPLRLLFIASSDVDFSLPVVRFFFPHRYIFFFQSFFICLLRTVSLTHHPADAFPPHKKSPSRLL